MKDYLNEHWRWENYRDFFGITIFRYLVLWFSIVPLLAALLSGLESPLRIPVGQHHINLELEVPFAWQVLWLSSFFFFLALGLYTFRCPKFIKKYHNFSEYLAVGHDKRWMVYEIRLLKNSGEDLTDFTEKLKTKSFATVTTATPTDKPEVRQHQTVYRFRSGRKNEGETIEIGTPISAVECSAASDAERGIFWEVFAAFSGSRFRTRAAILVLLGLSAACFTFVLFQHVMHGWNYVVTWLGTVLGRFCV